MGTGQLLAVPRLSLCSSTTIDLSLLTFLRSRLGTKLGQRFLGLPKLGIGAVVSENGEHAYRRVIEDVAMKSPNPGVVSIENHFDRRFSRNDECVPESSLDFSSIDLDDLNIVTVQMHRVTHAGVIPKYDLDALIFFYIETISIRISGAIDRPIIFRHVAAEDAGQRSVYWLI